MTTNLEDLPVSDGANIRLETNNVTFAKDVQTAAESGALHLPSRDIPQTQNHITQDQQSLPNHVPEPPQPYIEEKQVHFQQPPPATISQFDELCDRLQEPILIGILYFIFQMPIVRTSLMKLMPPLFQTDGNSNMGGYIFNSALFAGAYYGVMYTIEQMKI